MKMHNLNGHSYRGQSASEVEWPSHNSERPATPTAAVPGRSGRVACRWQEVQVLLAALVFSGLVVGVGMRPYDVWLYQHYARAALNSPLFHSLPREYPALSLVVFLLPQVLPFAYPVLFGLLAAAATAALVLLTDGVDGVPGWSRRTCIYLLCASIAVVFARYDVFPVLAAALAVEGARRGRWGRAWAWAVVGGLLKLFPLLLLPGFLVIERAKTGKWALRRPLVSVLPVVLLAGAQSLLSPGSLVSPLRYELKRGFELSSVQGSLSFLLDPLHARWASGFGSIEVLGSGNDVISLVFSLSVLTLLVTVWVLARQGRLSVEAVSLAALSLAVFSDKAFGAQYLMWLIPLWAYWPLRRGWVVAAGLTTLIYPVLYAEAQRWGPSYYLPTAVGAVRNIVLVTATACWFWQQVRQPRPAVNALVVEREDKAHVPTGRPAHALAELG